MNTRKYFSIFHLLCWKKTKFLPAELVEVPPNVEPPNGFLFALAADVDPPPRPLRNPPPPPPPKIEPPPLDSAGLDAPKLLSLYIKVRVCVCVSY